MTSLGGRPLSGSAIASSAMYVVLRQVWSAVRPVTAQQRFLWWCGALLLASGAVHAVVAALDWAPWSGAVSWRKPVVFGMSFGVLSWSAVWVMRQLPVRRWGWLPASLLGTGSVVEVALITMQRWRGEASHFNQKPAFDSAVWSVMGSVVILVAFAVALFLVWSLVRFEGTPAARIAVVAGLLAILVSGYIGFGMAGEGEAVVDATGRVPDTVVFGAEGSAKLAHAVGMHGLQVLGLLAVGLGLRLPSARAQVRLMFLAVVGYGALFASVATTAYAGLPWTAPNRWPALIGLAGAAAVVAVFVVVARRLPLGIERHRTAVMR
ncbi:hypothetical protein [Streptomyces sp. WMMC940]|uniref:hypothetical protein n=1 Tax=Streptomyces sp. WMMC940 TaxID=3015153 RepID=UPI0022B61666|nr:hypothetical protein [Streptomyces sp. WMMC940]MCZ7456231.1 hypothetical protein [Streptomyces sp. WMMC940]